MFRLIVQNVSIGSVACMTKQTIYTLGILGVIGAAVVYGLLSYRTATDDDVIKVGLIVSLTGKGADRGELVLEALEEAKRTIEQDGATRPIEFHVQDVPLDGTARAPIAYQALVDMGVDIVIGPMGSGPASAVAPLAVTARVPVIVHTASASAVAHQPLVVRLWPTAPQYAAMMVAEIERLGYQRVAIISSSNENTVELRNELLTYLGNRLVADEQVLPEAHDVRTQLTKIKEAAPDVVLLNVFEGQFQMVATQARALGIDAPFVANAVFGEREFDGGNRSVFEGMWFPRFAGWVDQDAAINEKLVASDSAAAAHDAFLMAVETVTAVGKKAEDIDHFIRTGTFTGVIGQYSFASNGNAQVPLVLKEVRGGVIVDKVR